MTPRVTVVIPTFNHARYLPDSIGSVLAQQFAEFEILVVDDGSTDDTASVVHGFADGRIRYIRQENLGLSAARNTGIAEARGEFVALLDADDLYEPAFLAVMLAQFEAVPAAGFAYCGYRFVDERNQSLRRVVSTVVPPERFRETLIDGNFLVPASVVARRDTYDRVGPFDTALRACEDWDMWLRMSGCFASVGTPLPLVRYRLLPLSMSSAAAHMARYRVAVLQKHLGPAPAAGRALAMGHLRNAVEYLEGGDVPGALAQLRQMVAAHPRLVVDPRTFYEIACAHQPRGERGDAASIDMVQARALVERAVAELSGDSVVRRVGVRRARAAAWLALGKLAYARRELASARRYVARAAVSNPWLLVTREPVSLLARTLAGRRLLEAGARRQRALRAQAIRRMHT